MARETRAPKEGEVTPSSGAQNGGPGEDPRSASYRDTALETDRDTAGRENVPAANRDKVWTSESRPRWGEADGDINPSLGDQLKALNESEKRSDDSLGDQVAALVKTDKKSH